MNIKRVGMVFLMGYFFELIKMGGWYDLGSVGQIKVNVLKLYLNYYKVLIYIFNLFF